MNKISIKKLRELLTYCSVTGTLVWKPRPGIARNDRAGRAAGHEKPDGYTLVTVCGIPFLKHRLCWAMNYGVWPKTYLDHIDGNPRNNAILNLRLATPAQNLQNTKQNKNNTSGAKGVYLHKHGKYEAYITKDKRRIYLGLFTHLDDAIAARTAAQTKLYTHGRVCA
jgi:hypothetical protein